MTCLVYAGENSDCDLSQDSINLPTRVCKCCCLVQKLPKVNRLLAERLLEEDSGSSKPSVVPTNVQNPIGDDRFAALFTNPDFEVDEASEEYQLLHPVLTHREKRRVKKREQREQLSSTTTHEGMEVGVYITTASSM